MCLISVSNKIILVALSTYFLVSCTTVSPTNATSFNHKSVAESDSDRMIKTAKINSQLGIAYLESNNIPRAKQKLLLSMKQGPNIPEPWYSMGYFLEATGNKEEANNYYLKALAISPTRGDVHNNYGTFLCRSQQYKQSIQQFLLATKDPDYLDVAAAYENAGSCAMKIPDTGLAKKYFEQALQQDPSRQTSLYKLAEIHYQAGEYVKAKEMLNPILTLGPPTPQTLALSVKINQRLPSSVINAKKNRPIQIAKLSTLHNGIN